MIKLEPYEAMRQARLEMLKKHGLFGTVAMGLQLIEDPNCRTAWTDGKFIGYNPEHIRKLDWSGTLYTDYHETGHVFLLHHLRRGNREPVAWNEACDYCVNAILVMNGIKLRPGALYDPKFKGMSAEQIYALRQKDQKGSQRGQQGQDQQEGQGNQQPQDGYKSNDPTGHGEVRDAKDSKGQTLTEAEMKQAEQDFKVFLATAIQQSKAMGRLPGGIEHIIESVTVPKMTFIDHLHRFVSQVAKSDYSWSKPNKRFLASGFYLPSLHNLEFGKVVYAIDSSGSVGPRELSLYMEGLDLIFQTFPSATITVISCDSKVHNTAEISAQDWPQEFIPQGGGGTDYRPVFEWADENLLEKPTCLVYVTDGQCNRYPEVEPDYPVLWVGSRGPFEPKFGEFTELM